MTQDKAVQQRRDEKLAQYTASLERIAKLVDFAAVAAAVDAACPRPDRGKGGWPPYATPLMVRVLLLQALCNLSDEEVERQLLDRRSFQCFCGLMDELHVPDARTVWLFRQRLVAGGLGARAVFRPCSNSCRHAATFRAAARSSTLPSCERPCSTWASARRRTSR